MVNSNESFIEKVNDVDIIFYDTIEEEQEKEDYQSHIIEHNNIDNNINSNEHINDNNNKIFFDKNRNNNTNENNSNGESIESLKEKIKVLEKQKMRCEQKLLNFQKLYNSELEKEKKRLKKNIQKEVEKDKKKEKQQQIDDTKDEKDETFQENNTLKDIIKELKSEIYELRQNLIKSNNNLNNVKRDNEKIKKENLLYFKEVQALNSYVLKLENGFGSESEINNLKKLTSEQNKLILNLSEQIKEYQSKVDKIIIGKSLEEKDEQIKLLVNEVKGVRSRILNIITFEGRIQNMDELIEILYKIKKEISESKNNKMKEAYKKLNELIDIYKLNNEKYFNNIMLQIFKINPNSNNQLFEK
jgi:DNA repair exonuclease SbcCD ATPase subunit